MSAILTVAAIWFTPSALIFAWIYADRWLDSRYDDEPCADCDRTDTDAEWLAVIAATDTPIYSGLLVDRMRAELEKDGAA